MNTTAQQMKLISCDEKTQLSTCSLCEAFLCGEWTEDEKRHFLAHLENCSPCTDFVAAVLILEEDFIEATETKLGDFALTRQIPVRAFAAGGTW